MDVLLLLLLHHLLCQTLNAYSVLDIIRRVDPTPMVNPIHMAVKAPLGLHKSFVHKADPRPVVDPIPMVDFIHMVDSIPMVDPIYGIYPYIPIRTPLLLPPINVDPYALVSRMHWCSLISLSVASSLRTDADKRRRNKKRLQDAAAAAAAAAGNHESEDGIDTGVDEEEDDDLTEELEEEDGDGYGLDMERIKLINVRDHISLGT